MKRTVGTGFASISTLHSMSRSAAIAETGQPGFMITTHVPLDTSVNPSGAPARCSASAALLSWMPLCRAIPAGTSHPRPLTDSSPMTSPARRSGGIFARQPILVTSEL